MSRFQFGGGFPFGGMGGGFDESSNESREVDNKSLYKVLELDENADLASIKKAYKKMAIKHHPDKGGNPDKFREISEANEILSNPEKKELYDKYGMEGVKGGGGGGGPGGFGDIFDMFGMGGGQKGPKKAQKGKPILKEQKVTFEDVYQGKLFKINHSKKQLCDKCDGKGASTLKKCVTCKGQGMVVKMQMLGPGMYQQSTQPCGTCQGQGQSYDEKDKCSTCKGKKFMDQKTQIEVSVEPGCPHEYDYVYNGMADDIPGAMAGDVHVRIMIQKHKDFQRQGADLFIDKQISLLEALTGTNFSIKHLDGTQLKVSTLPKDVISHNEIKCVKGKGMPFFKDAMGHGNLYIKFIVQMPKRGEINPEQIQALSSVLIGPQITPVQKGEQVEYLDDFLECDMNPSAEGGKKKQDEDDEDHQQGHQQNVQCAQQ